VTPGSGPLITELDGVIIEYTGRTEDGTVFDTTDGRGPAPFLVMQVVPGFRQALTQMQKGGRYRIVIPGRLAYGRNPPQGSPIGVNEDLSFDVFVQDVAPGAAVQLGAAPQQAQ
jgi:FKBP-type peptidyl-prolyl cis-trans isomerase FkpA